MIGILWGAVGVVLAPVVHEVGHCLAALAVGKPLRWMWRFPRLLWEMPPGTSHSKAAFIALAGFGAQWFAAVLLAAMFPLCEGVVPLYPVLVGFLTGSTWEWWTYPHGSPANDFNHLDSDDMKEAE